VLACEKNFALHARRFKASHSKTFRTFCKIFCATRVALRSQRCKKSLFRRYFFNVAQDATQRARREIFSRMSRATFAAVAHEASARVRAYTVR
jgi:hypothetical protein